MLLVGCTRVGKSTLFHAYRGQALEGVKEHGKIYYAQQTGGATIKLSTISETLWPNIANLNNLSLADTAGYMDSRDYVGVIGVSYMLQELFRRIKRVKFIIVIPELAI